MRIFYSCRYPNCNIKNLKKQTIKHLYDKSDVPFNAINYETPITKVVNSAKAKGSLALSAF